MAILFGQRLRDPIRVYSRGIQNHVTELTARQGIADFVLSPTLLRGDRLEWLTKLATSITSPSAAAVASNLQVGRNSTVEVISRKSGVSGKTALRALEGMTKEGVVRETVGCGFRLAKPIRDTDLELWAFELKLKNLKRAMYQALQYKAFAHSVSIVVPEDAARLAAPRLHEFRSHRVGVLTFNPTNGTLRVLVRPSRSRPISREQYLFALSKFMTGLPWHPHYAGPPKGPILPHSRARRKSPSRRIQSPAASPPRNPASEDARSDSRDSSA